MVPTEAAPGTAIRWIGAGGGTDPAHQQVSLEQDLALARRAFGPGGVVLFGAGPGTQGVRVLDPKPRGDPLLQELADLFDGDGARDSHFEAVTLPADGPFAPDSLESTLRRALAQGTGPLTLYVASHGSQGRTRRQNSFDTWGGYGETVADLAKILDGAPDRRPLRMVITSCFSGAFADLVFRGADPGRGVAEGTRCGLFAATWDRPASGCDPNPDRAAQQGYGIYFLHALKREDRAGKKLPVHVFDLNGDGHISLLEAHVQAVIHGGSFDVPTTTSERYLRVVAPKTGPEKPVPLPEWRAEVRALSARVHLHGAKELAGGLKQIRARLARLTRKAQQAESAANDAALTAEYALLARWPVLSDPWHPDFLATVEGHRDTIARFLAEDSRVADWRADRSAANAAWAEVDADQGEAGPGGAPGPGRGDADPGGAPPRPGREALEDLPAPPRLRAWGALGPKGYFSGKAPTMSLRSPGKRASHSRRSSLSFLTRRSYSSWV